MLRSRPEPDQALMQNLRNPCAHDPNEVVQRLNAQQPLTGHERTDALVRELMPHRLFARDVAGREATFRTVASLAAADMYDVSLTAGAWRLVETTREACALVLSVDGQIEWIVRSDAWRYPLSERRRPLPPGSAGEAVSRGEAPNHDAQQLDPLVWLASADGRWLAPTGAELFESTHTVRRLRQVISLLWVVDDGG